MGKYLVCGPTTSNGGGVQLTVRQTGSQRSDASRRFCEDGQNLLIGERFIGLETPPFAQSG